MSATFAALLLALVGGLIWWRMRPHMRLLGREAYFDILPCFRLADAEAVRQALAANPDLLAAHLRVTRLDWIFAPVWMLGLIAAATIPDGSPWPAVLPALLGGASDLMENVLVAKLLAAPQVPLTRLSATALAIATTIKFSAYALALALAVFAFVVAGQTW